MSGFEKLGMHGDELYALVGIADLHLMQRDLPAALAELSRGATLSREYARADQEARFLQRLGILYSEAGDDEAAREHWRRALSLHHAAGNQTGEAAVLMQLGDLVAELGDRAEAERS
jgi:tetratricopeptide (TPR) repeat protein